MNLLAGGLLVGFFTSAVVTWWPSTWQFAPGIIFGIAIVCYFAKDIWRAHPRKWISISEMVGFVALSYLAYAIALIEAEWVLGTSGFATFDSYASSNALPALYLGCFVGCCIGTFILALCLRILFLRFDLVRGLFLFVLFSGALGSTIVAGFESFGFVPQFLFPAWCLGTTGVF